MNRELTIAACLKMIEPIVAKRAEEYTKHGEPYRFDMLAGYDIAKAAHKMALEDLKPVLDAARREIDSCTYCQAAIKGTGGCFGSHQALRDALAEINHD